MSVLRILGEIRFEDSVSPLLLIAQQSMKPITMLKIPLICAWRLVQNLRILGVKIVRGRVMMTVKLVLSIMIQGCVLISARLVWMEMAPSLTKECAISCV